MLDLFVPNDDVNVVATVLFRKLRSGHGVPCNDIICGTVHLVKENEHDVIDFTMEDYVYVVMQVLTDVW
jgi:hypothetical protein